jgi:hypothetical protein
MAGKTTIRPDKKLNTKVTITDKAGAVRATDYPLLADTGAVITIIGYESGAKGGTWTTGALIRIGGVGGEAPSVMQLSGGSVSIETEPQGGGATTNFLSGRITAAFGPNPLPGLGANTNGILGMDAMDIIDADPQKNLAATAARMAIRTT